MSKEKKKNGCGSILWIIIILAIIGSFLDDDNAEDAPKINYEISEESELNSENSNYENNNNNGEQIGEVETENTNPFIDSLSKHMEINYAENVYDIYVNELGFETVEFKEKLGETGNYSITANGYHTVATVMDD